MNKNAAVVALRARQSYVVDALTGTRKLDDEASWLQS